MNFKEIFQPTHLNKLLIILSVIVILVFVFAAGVFVGQEKGKFSCRWGENYYRNIMGPGMFNKMDFGRPAFNAHSGLGQIIKIDGNTLIIKDPSNTEKTILITDQTTIIKDGQSIKVGDLQIDDKIAAIGQPNEQGQIEPKFIRVLTGQPEQPPFMPEQPR